MDEGNREAYYTRDGQSFYDLYITSLSVSSL